ncbi:hypothetical protein Tco_0264435 [Tanacetum coccineum]
MKAKPICKTVTFIESSNKSKLMEKMEALTTKIDSQFKDIKGEMKEMRDGCNSCRGPHPSSECDEKPMGGPKDEEANYAYGGYRGGGYRGNYYGRSSRNWRDRQQRDKNRNSQPQEDAPSVPPTLEKNPTNDKPYRPPSARNEHVNAVFTWSGLTYDPLVNPNAKSTIIYDDSEDEADEAEKEVEPSSSKQTKSDPPPLKGYKPKISYPQRLCKEKMEERYAKFIELIKEVRINVPLVEVLAGMPNYRKLLKDLGSNKSKMEQIYVAFLNEECSAIVQNKLPPKLGDPGSFLIPCTVAGSVEHLALTDLRASINLMPYSLYASLSGNTLKPTRMKLNLRAGDDRITFLIDKAMRHSHSNDDTCFRVDVIDEVTEEELDALIDDSKPFSTTSEKISESYLDHEFEEFMEVEIKEIPDQEEEFENSFEVLPLQGNQMIKNSI